MQNFKIEWALLWPIINNSQYSLKFVQNFVSYFSIRKTKQTKASVAEVIKCRIFCDHKCLALLTSWWFSTVVSIILMHFGVLWTLHMGQSSAAGLYHNWVHRVQAPLKTVMLDYYRAAIEKLANDLWLLFHDTSMRTCKEPCCPDPVLFSCLLRSIHTSLSDFVIFNFWKNWKWAYYNKWHMSFDSVSVSLCNMSFWPSCFSKVSSSHNSRES